MHNTGATREVARSGVGAARVLDEGQPKDAPPPHNDDTLDAPPRPVIHTLPGHFFRRPTKSRHTGPQGSTTAAALTRAPAATRRIRDGPPKGRRASPEARPIYWGRHDGRARDDLEGPAPPPSL